MPGPIAPAPTLISPDQPLHRLWCDTEDTGVLMCHTEGTAGGMWIGDGAQSPSLVPDARQRT